jgi:hypothetical protein
MVYYFWSLIWVLKESVYMIKVENGNYANLFLGLGMKNGSISDRVGKNSNIRKMLSHNEK